MGDRGAQRWDAGGRGSPSASRCRASGTPILSLADRYRFFSEFEAVDAPTYALLGDRIASDEDLLGLLEPLTPREKQPNLFLSSVNHLGGMSGDFDEFRSFVLENRNEVFGLIRTRRTQTNEIGRCATLLPALALIPGPLALIEVGASAGLNLLLDRFAYDYGDGGVLGDRASSVVIPCRLRNDVPLPSSVPEVVWRRGIDLEPVDVRDREAVRWLESCVFVDHVDRLGRLKAAVELAREDPPIIVQGDLVEEISGVVADAPKDASIVVFHSAVLAYLERDRRQLFAELMDQLPVVWLSNEAPPVIASVQAALDRPLPPEICFLLGRNGREVLAITHHHGRWIEWLGERSTN